MLVDSQKPAPRSGFTMIELLVVIAIIAVLAALGAGAYFRVISSQELKRTRATVAKIHGALNAQWSAARDDIDQEFKGGKAGTATKAVYLNARMVQEFPMNFTEAAAKYPTLSGVTSQGSDVDNAVCLYAVLSKTRRGVSFSGDDVGASSVRSVKLSNNSVVNYFVDAWGQPIKLNRPSNPANSTADLYVFSAGPDKSFASQNDNIISSEQN